MTENPPKSKAAMVRKARETKPSESNPLLDEIKESLESLEESFESEVDRFQRLITANNHNLKVLTEEQIEKSRSEIKALFSSEIETLKILNTRLSKIPTETARTLEHHRDELTQAAMAYRNGLEKIFQLADTLQKRQAEIMRDSAHFKENMTALHREIRSEIWISNYKFLFLFCLGSALMGALIYHAFQNL